MRLTSTVLALLIPGAMMGDHPRVVKVKARDVVKESCPEAAGGEPTIRVVALDQSDVPLPGVTVEVKGEGWQRTATADAHGTTTMALPSAGRAALRASLSGFDIVLVRGLRVRAGCLAEVTVKLPAWAVDPICDPKDKLPCL